MSLHHRHVRTGSRMLLSGFVVVAVLALPSAFGSAAQPAGGAGAGTAYDEVVKFLLTDSAPPDPGAFQADYAAAVSAQKAPTNQHHGMFGSIMNAADAVKNAVGMVKNGTVTRYSFLNGWERTEDVAAQTATITKPSMHQIVYLDLAKKTYRVVDTNAAPVTATPPPYEPPQKQEPAKQQQPGKAKLNISTSTTNLGPKTIDDIATTGYRTTFKMTMSQATGSCRNGTFEVNETSYLAKFSMPQSGSGGGQHAKVSQVMPRPESMVAPSGCSPALTVHSSGGSVPAGRFAMYEAMKLGGNAGAQTATGSFGTVIERGNVHALGAADTELFAIPPGFTQQS
ncbi:MAG: hypothetical protein GIW99_04315 [Candidatus Eremiobacteraeota bacterium]|nr:hypothetical protein [Candidatus Eremiobacteraeota bacterium]MBC5826897.1 hypothetical protein [Candidatus Eremiobacteraeota bacterium]